MTKYLICESKARAMGISRETYVSFVESMGYTYSNATHSDDSYGHIAKVTTDTIDGVEVEIKSYALVVDDSVPYYANFPTMLKSRLVEASVMVVDGWDVTIPEVIETIE